MDAAGLMPWETSPPPTDTQPRAKRNAPQEFLSGAHVPGLDDEPTCGRRFSEPGYSCRLPVLHEGRCNQVLDSVPDEQPSPPADERPSPADAAMIETMAYKPPSSEIEHKAGIESLDGLNAAILRIAEDYGDILHLFRGGGSHGSAADSARKRHRALISKQIEARMQDEAQKAGKDYKKLSDPNLEMQANASPEHIAFCAQLDLNGILYESIRARKEALEARRNSRLEELRVYGKSFYVER